MDLYADRPLDNFGDRLGVRNLKDKKDMIILFKIILGLICGSLWLITGAVGMILVSNSSLVPWPWVESRPARTLLFLMGPFSLIAGVFLLGIQLVSKQ